MDVINELREKLLKVLNEANVPIEVMELLLENMLLTVQKAKQEFIEKQKKEQENQEEKGEDK